MTKSSMTGVVLVFAWTLFNIGISESRLTQSRLQNSHLQRVLNHKRVSVILEGVRNRALTTIQNDPILQISFPQIAHTFEIHLLEDTSTLKFTLKHQDGTWCENIIVPELRLLGNTTTNDHLVISFEQGKKSGGHLLVYFSCIPKGRLHLPYSLKEMNHQVKHSKVKLYHGDDLEIKVDGNASLDAILEDLECPVERMQAQDPANGDPNDDLYSYRRGDIPIFNFDEADRVLIATLQELIEALRKLKAEVNIQKQETMLLRKALQECKACRIKRPECSDDPPPCFPKVECRDTNDGPVCGPCPQGLYTIATFTKDQSHDHLPLHFMVSNWSVDLFW